MFDKPTSGHLLSVPASGLGPIWSSWRRVAKWIGVLAAGIALTACNNSSQTASGDFKRCDRECIIALTDRYVDAVLSNDIAGAQLADDFKLVENLQVADQERDTWQYAIEGPPSFAVHVPDPRNQQAGWMGVVNHAGKPVLLALRLRFSEGRIVEAEHLFTDLVDGSEAGLGVIHPDLGSTIETQDRLDHQELIRIGASYYNALDGNDGSLSPFSPDCKRIENGLIAAGEGALAVREGSPFQPGVASDCRSQIDSQAFVFIDRIENRRMVAADPVTGLVMGFSRFRHSMENLPYKITFSDGSTGQVDRQNLTLEPFDLATAHVFKVGPEGMITSIEAVGLRAPYGTPKEWE